MGKIISKVSDFMQQNGYQPMDLVRAGLPVGTAYRAVRGDGNLTLELVARLCDILHASEIGDLFEYQKESAVQTDGAQG